MTVWLLVTVFFATALIGVPIAMSFGLGAVAGLSAMDVPILILPQRMLAGIDSFPFLAVPFFILAGELMSGTGITGRLVALAYSLVGHVRGGLAHATIVAEIFFSGITGTAVGDAAALGPLMIPAMIAKGFGRGVSAAVVGAAAILGPLIPPSTGMVVYSLILGGTVSITGLFLAGVVPGLILAGALMALSYVLAPTAPSPDGRRRFSASLVLTRLRESTWALVTPIIILGGILGGVFTVTEAAAVAALYTFVVGAVIFRTLTPRVLYGALSRTVVISGMVVLLLATSEIVSWILTVQRVPDMLTRLLMAVSTDRNVFMLLFLIFMMVAGIFIEPVPLMVMFAPIVAPIAHNFGFHPLHFGLVFILAANLALITPPVGAVLFVLCGIGNLKIEEISRAILPFVVVEVGVLAILAFYPPLSLWLPGLFGFR